MTTTQYAPESAPDALAWYDPSYVANLRANADGSGANPAALNDPVKYAVSRVAGGLVASHALGALWTPNGMNGAPSLKYSAANLLVTAAMFLAKHERQLTIACNIISTTAVSSPVIYSTNNAAMWCQEVGGLKSWSIAGNTIHVGTGVAAPGVVESLYMKYDGHRFAVLASQDGYRRDNGPGGLFTYGLEYSADLGIAGTGMTMGGLGGGGFNFTGHFGDFIAIGRFVEGSEESDLRGFLAERAATANSVCVFYIGDSILDGVDQGQDTRPALANVCEIAYAMTTAAGYRLNRMRDAIPGRTGGQWLSEQGLRFAPFVFKGLPGSGSRQMAFINFAHNDLRSSGVDITFDCIIEICARCIQNGVTPFYIMPIAANVVGFEALRQSLNTRLLARQALNPFCAGLIRWDTDEIAGDPANTTDLTWFQDGIHPTPKLNAERLSAYLDTTQQDFTAGRIPAANQLGPVRNVTMTSEEVRVS